MWVTYSSLINARLPVMPSDISELMLSIGSVSRDRHRLRDEMRKRRLAVLDRDGVYARPRRLVLALLRKLRRGAGGETGRGRDAVSDNEVVEVHGLRRGYVLLGRLAQLGDATGGVL